MIASRRTAALSSAFASVWRRGRTALIDRGWSRESSSSESSAEPRQAGLWSSRPRRSSSSFARQRNCPIALNATARSRKSELRAASSSSSPHCERRSASSRSEPACASSSAWAATSESVTAATLANPLKVDSRTVAHRVVLIPGDGTGPELTEATRRVLEATGVEFEWDVREAGADVMDQHGGNPLPEDVLDAIRETGVALKGPITTPVGGGFRSVNVALRKELDMYAQVRPCKSYPGVRSRFDDVDLIIVRENTEDLYAGIEYEQGTEDVKELIAWITSKGGKLRHEDAGISIKPISVTGTRRIFEFAFDYARKNGRRKITAVHKANIMKFTDGLWLRVAREVAAENPDVEFDDRIVDNMCMQLVQRPEEYDVLVLPNLYGDVLSDLCAGMIGGLGVAPGGNHGETVAVFEPTHGSAPKYAGQNKVNPIAQMLSGVLMLRHLDERSAANGLEAAIAEVIREGKSVTYDMKPSRDDPTAVGTSEVADAVIEKLEAEVPA